LIPEAQNIKRAIQIPVIAVGRIDLDQAEKILRQGSADFIAMGRPLLADPELPEKLATGQLRDIRKCIYCYTCVHQIFVGTISAALLIRQWAKKASRHPHLHRYRKKY
jgi:2,4-dienoyl-CoA reductase-like NADH-dependent reductase (Old Yellow Enzyme family)